MTPYLEVEEVAAMMRTNTGTIRRWIREKRLRAVKIGRKFLISPTDLQVLIAEWETRPQTDAEKAAAAADGNGSSSAASPAPQMD